MANYNVDIAVALKGAEQVGRFNKQIKDVAENIKSANIFLKSFSAGSEGLARSVSNLQKNLGGTSNNLRTVALGTKEATIAASQFLKAQGDLNKGLAQQQKLLDDLSGATAKKTAADQQQLQAGLLRLETKGTRNLEEDFKTRQKFQTEFANELDKVNKRRKAENDLIKQSIEKTKQTVAQEIKKKFSIMASQKARKANFQQSVREFELENRINKVLQNRQRLRERRQKLRGAASNALIGGAFPLLFGQGAGASVGGALGGFGGGLLGGQFGFALSLVGTSLGSAVDRFVDGARKVGEAMNENSKEFDRVLNVVGKEGANKLSTFATETKLLTKTFGDFFLNVQSGVAGLINMTGILSGMIAKMQRGIAERQVKRSQNFKTAVQGLRGQGGQGAKRRNILSEMTDVQFEKNLQGAANLEADTSAELIEKELQGLERKLEIADADNHAMATAIELRNQQVDIIEKLKAAGAVLDEQDEARIGKLVTDIQLLEDKKDLELFFKENAKEMRSIEDQDEKNLADTLKKLDKLKESANATTENMAKQNELNLVKLTGDEYEIALKEQLLSLNKEELAMFDEEKFKIEFNNKLRIDGLLKQKQLTEEVTNMMAQGMGDAIKGLITGTQSLNDSLRNVLNNMANAFLNFGLFGNFGGTFEKGAGLLGGLFKAKGGPVKGGNSYIVGERGPEMFSPGVSGTITPNHALGGSTNIVVNVDASGSSVEGDEQQGRQLGNVISAAIQAQLIQEKRPGGLLA